MSGRPLRFIGATLVCWTTARAIMLWPIAGPAALPRVILPAAFADDAPRETSASPLESGAGIVTPWTPRTAAVERPRVVAIRTAAAPLAPARPVLATDTVPAAVASGTRQSVLALPAPMPAVAGSTPRRWSVSGWFVLRDGRGIAPGLGGGQLGGSQAGLRVAYAIDAARRVAIVGRLATPLKGAGREGAVGVEWRPTRLPVRLIGEYRVSLDGGASGPAAGIIAGTGPAPLALGFDLETYAQAGIVRRRRAEPYAEGAARLSRPIMSIGGAKIDLGIGGWGGAQRGVQRLDMGPSLGVRIPVAGKAIRASLDWRQRIAGNARPGSGPVLVIGSDF